MRSLSRVVKGKKAIDVTEMYQFFSDFALEEEKEEEVPETEEAEDLISGCSFDSFNHPNKSFIVSGTYCAGVPAWINCSPAYTPTPLLRNVPASDTRLLIIYLCAVSKSFNEYGANL